MSDYFHDLLLANGGDVNAGRRVNEHLAEVDARLAQRSETGSADGLGSTMSDIEVNVQVTHEPLTYEPHAGRSYFRDRVLALNSGDVAAEARLQRHAAEMRKVIPAREADREKRARAAGIEYRVNPNTTDGTGGYFAAPVWLVDHFASAPRAERVLARRMTSLPLPAGANQVSVPRLTTGTLVGVETDGSAVPGQDIADAAVTQPVSPLAGQSDVPLPMLEQSPAGAHLDWALFKDLSDSYDSQLEALLFNGSGTGQTFTGILNLTTGAGAVSAVAYTSASPTYTEILVPSSKAIAQLGDARLAPPEVLLMRTARWGWLAAGDTNLAALGRPQWLGFPVDLADGIPTTVGGAGRDAIVAIRASDSLLLESEQSTDVMFEPLSGVLGVRLRLHGYATAIHRQPTGIATVTGTGQVVQSGY